MAMARLESSQETGLSLGSLITVVSEQMKCVLVVDDDPSIRDMLERYLGQHGYRVRTASDSTTTSRLIRDYQFDLVILDLMLAGEDGLTLARKIRDGSDLPIIILSAKGDEIDRIIGLEMGADDYLPKPFSPRELLARMKSVLRRADATQVGKVDSGPTGDVARFAGWVLDVAKREIRSATNECVELTSGEFDLLSAFVARPRRMLSREQLLDYAHGGKRFPFDRSIDIQVMRLRRKIEDDPKHPVIIKTVRGAGYIFTPRVEWS